ncbi:unnamed protein product [Caretta caretta]
MKNNDFKAGEWTADIKDRWVVTYCSRTQVRQVFLSLDHLINCPVRNGIGALIQYTNEEMEKVEVEDQHIIDECDQLIPGKTATECTR